MAPAASGESQKRDGDNKMEQGWVGWEMDEGEECAPAVSGEAPNRDGDELGGEVGSKEVVEVEEEEEVEVRE